MGGRHSSHKAAQADSISGRTAPSDPFHPGPPKSEFDIDVLPLPNGGFRLVFNGIETTPPPVQPLNGDIVSLWSVMSNAGDGFLQVTGRKVPGKDDYIINMAGTLDNDATKFVWTTNFEGAKPNAKRTKPGTPWVVLSDLDPIILTIQGKQFKDDGDEAWYVVMVDGDYVVAKPKDSVVGCTSDNTESHVFNPSRWPVYTTPEVGRNIRFNIYNAESNVFLGASADGTARKVSQEGDPEGANYYWPNPAILFLVYDRGQP